MEDRHRPLPPPPPRGSSSGLAQRLPSSSPSFPSSYLPYPPQPPSPSQPSRTTPFFHSLALPPPSSPRGGAYYPTSPRDAVTAPSPGSRPGGGSSLGLGITDPSSWADRRQPPPKESAAPRWSPAFTRPDDAPPLRPWDSPSTYPARNSLDAQISSLVSKDDTIGEKRPSQSDDQPKKKKRRQALSCAECSKRKQKCNREQPCQHCVSRKVPHLCVPVARSEESVDLTPRKEVKEVKEVKQEVKEKVAKPDVKTRLELVERMLGAVVQRVDVDEVLLTEWKNVHPPPSPPTDEVDDTAESEENWVTLDTRTAARNPGPLIEAKILPRIDQHGTIDDSLQRLFNDYGVDPKRLRGSIQDLPTKERADVLIEWFFEKFNHVRYPIDRKLFEKAYETVYAASEVIVPAAIIALPLVFIVLAIAIRIKPEAGTDEKRRAWSLKLYWRSTTSIRLATALVTEHIQLVETRLLTGLYLVLMHERRLAEGWQCLRAAVTTGQLIGLHRDGSKLGFDRYLTEYRRRLWSYLCHADATYSCLLGRPTMIDPVYSDTRLPSNINLHEIEKGPEPMDKPTFATYLILRAQLARVVAMIVKHFQRLDGGMQYHDVEAIDAEFETLRRELPPQFYMLNPDKSFDEDLWYLKLHRYYIQTEILHFTIILHRPWLLRKLRSGKYKLSRNACFEAAVTDFKIRQAFKIDCPDFFETLLGGSFREFNTAMIAGIGLLMEPDSARCPDLWLIMTNYMDHHPHDPMKDDFSKSEAAIIHTLHRRATELHKNRVKPRPVETSYERGGGVEDEEEDELEDDEVEQVANGGPRVDSRRESNGETPRSNEDVGQQMLNQFFDFGPTSFGAPADPSLFLLRNMPKDNGYYDPTWQTPVVAGPPPSTSFYTDGGYAMIPGEATEPTMIVPSNVGVVGGEVGAIGNGMNGVMVNGMMMGVDPNFQGPRIPVNSGIEFNQEYWDKFATHIQQWPHGS